jgi:hypothetical protein
MAHAGQLQDLRPERQRGRHKNPALKKDDVVGDRPARACCARLDLLLLGDDLRQGLRFLAELVE